MFSLLDDHAYRNGLNFVAIRSILIIVIIIHTFFALVWRLFRVFVSHVFTGRASDWLAAHQWYIMV